MKRTLNMNLNGIVFSIDDDAYDMLEKYLADIAARFEADGDKDEIMADIEARIAELLGERVQRNKEVVTLIDVQEVMAIMGAPNQYADDEAQGEPAAANERKKKRSSRFYRDPEGAVLGGVCGGVAARFGWDVAVVRLALAAITLLSMVANGGWFLMLAYILMWMIVPKAVTPSQRLEMQGEEVTVENIKAEFDNLKNYVEGDEFRSSARTVGQRVGSVLLKIFKIGFSVVFALFVAALVFAVFVAVICLFSVGGVLSIAGLAEMLPSVIWAWPDQWEHMVLLAVSVLLVFGCPVFALVYALVRGVSGHRSKSKTAYWVMLLLWLAGIFMFIGGVAKQREEMWPDMFSTRMQPASHVQAVACAEDGGKPWLTLEVDGRADEEPEDGGEMLCRLCEVAPFRAVVFKGVFDVELTQSANRMLVLNAPELYMPHIVAEVKGDTLHVGLNKTGYSARSFRELRSKLKACKVSLSSEAFESICAEGVVNLHSLTPLRAENLRLHMEGLSNADLELDVERRVDMSVEGVANVDVSGRCDRLDLRVEGMSNVDAEDFTSRHAKIRSEGMGQVEVCASESVDAQADGMASIVCHGNPQQVTTGKSGLARVKVK